MAKPEKSAAPPKGKKRPHQERDGAQPAKKSKDAAGKPAPKQLPPNMTRKEKKDLIREKKAKRQKNFTLIQEVVGLWEELRRHDISDDKRRKLITAVLAKVQGHMAELAASHTAARVIQACVKHGSAAERARVLEELSPKLLDLAKSPYGHFVVSKLVNLAPKEQLPGILKLFRGHIPALLRHPAGTHVVDDLWAAADAKQRNAMAAEFYGREYVLFEGGTINNQAGGAPAHLSDLLAGVEPAKRRAVMTHMSQGLVPIMEKGLVDPPLVHRLVAEYLAAAPASLVADAVESLSGEALLHMVHTKEGARAACMALAYGTAKDRKKAVKAMKGHVGTMARDEWGHLVLLTALSVVDDTALLKKFVVGELQKELGELVVDRYGHRVVLQLLHPYCPRYLPPQLLAIAQPPQKVYEAVAGAAAAAGAAQAEGSDCEAESDDEEDGEGGGSGRPTSGPLGVSKKDNATRRKELLGSGGSSLAAALAQLCAEQADPLLRSQAACDVVEEVCCSGEGGLLLGCAGDAAVHAVHEAVAAAVAAGEPGGEGEEEPLLTHYFASRALRRLVLASCGADAGGSSYEVSRGAAARCVEALWLRGGLKGGCSKWVGTHAAKVLAALVRCGSGLVRVEAAAELAPLVAPQKVQDWAEHLAGPAAQHAKQHKPGKRKKEGAAGAAPAAQQQAAGKGQQQQQKKKKQKKGGQKQ